MPSSDFFVVLTLSDILECLAHHFGIPTHAEEMLLKNIRTSIARMGGIHGGGVIYLHAHSQGGLITYRVLRMLTAEERAMIDVTTYGSAKMISGMGLLGSRNYINSDLVPFISDPVPRTLDIWKPNPPAYFDFLASCNRLPILK